MPEHGLLDDLMYPAAVEVVIAYLQSVLPDVPAEDIDAVNPNRIHGPAVRVMRVGGTDDGIDDRARMVVVAMDTSYLGAQALAIRIRKLMSGDAGVGGLNDAEVTLPGGSVVWVSSCTTDVAPERLPATNPEIDQEPGYYRVVLPAQ